MKKQQFKKLSKAWNSTLLYFNYSNKLSKDDDLKTNQTSTKNDSPFKMEIISKEKMSENIEISKAFNKFISIKNKRQNKTVYNSDYEFTVDTDFVKYIESNDGSINSYTFKIYRDEDNGFLENLVLTLQPDGTYDNKFVRYNYIDDNTLEISYADLDIDADDYLSKLTIVETCVTTVTGTCHEWMDNGDCDFWQFSSSTSCSYSIYDTGGGGGGGSTSGSGNTGGPNWGGTVWTNNGGGGSTSGSSPVVTSPTTPQPWEEVVLCLGLVSQSNTGTSNGFTSEMSTWLQNQPKCVSGSINNFLDENSCSEDAQELAVNEIIDSMNGEIMLLPNFTDPSEIEAEYSTSLFGDQPDPTTQLDHEAIKLQYAQELAANGNLAAVNYLINTYSMELFDTVNVTGNYNIVFDPVTTNEAHTDSSYDANGNFLYSTITLENGLITNSDFGYTTRAIKHELLHVLQNKYLGLSISSPAKEFDAYYYSLFRFKELPIYNNFTATRWAKRVKLNWDLLNDTEKAQRQSSYNKFKEYFSEICED